MGKLKERFWTEACAEYLKRLRPYAQIEVVQVPDVDPSRAGSETAATEREGEGILRAIPDSAFTILLAIEGKQLSSEQFAQKLDQLMTEGAGGGNLVFVVGGSYGVSSDVYKRANMMMSFGPITLPHNLARVVLLEQIYRAFKIMRGEPYHK